jgi:hypothetical protein
MKIKIHYQSVQETVQVRDAAEALARLKAEAAKRLPFLQRTVVKSLSDLAFAAEAVKRANAASGHNDPAPTSAQAFLDWAVARGYATILEP